jgi:hypothetical protein
MEGPTVAEQVVTPGSMVGSADGPGAAVELGMAAAEAVLESVVATVEAVAGPAGRAKRIADAGLFAEG